MRVTLLDAKNQIDTTSIGVQACSPAFLQLLNESIQRLVTGPENFWELTSKMAICAYNGLITWPRDVASIQAIAVCGQSVTVRSQWFEFLESGYGIRGCANNCESQMFDRGTGVTFREGRNTYAIKVATEVIEAADLEMVILGYDCTGKWIRTQDDDGNWRDGVYVPIPTTAGAPYLGDIQFAQNGITEIIKPITNGRVFLSDYLISDPTDTQVIGIYEWDETRPSYRKCLVGGLFRNQSEDDTTTQMRRVDVIYKREFRPVRNDNDFLMIGNIPALSEMCMAVKLSRQNSLQLASGHEGKALQLLDREANHYVGTNTVEPLRVDYRNFGAGGIPTLY